MLALFIAFLLLVLGGLYLAFPAGLTSVRFLVVLALGVLGVLTYFIYEKVRAILSELDKIKGRVNNLLPGFRDPPDAPTVGQPPGF
jgi:hypothetical protein